MRVFYFLSFFFFFQLLFTLLISFNLFDYGFNVDTFWTDDCYIPCISGGFCPVLGILLLSCLLLNGLLCPGSLNRAFLLFCPGLL